MLMVSGAIYLKSHTRIGDVSRLAVFDLDRTLIAGSSAEVFGRMLRDVGVELPPSPGQSTYFRLYERFGEDPITMRVARHAARLFKGQSVRKVQTAGRLAADVVASRLLHGANLELERHRSDGTELLLATTAPAEFAQPFAALVGIDHVLCTQYRSTDDTYDGTNEGGYLWGAEKAEAVASWAGVNAIDLTQSTAYSDSWYDVPLLELVGNPVAVNPDVRLQLVARAKDWRRESWSADQNAGQLPHSELEPT